MIIRPLHRWKSFWFGLLVLVFLSWGWARSVYRYDAVSWGEAAGGRGVSLGQRDSLIIVRWNTTKSPAGFMPGLQPLSVIMGPREHPPFPQVLSPTAISRGPQDFPTASLPHWSFILLFLIPWTAYLLWRVRRLKRLAAGGAEPPARSST